MIKEIDIDEVHDFLNYDDKLFEHCMSDEDIRRRKEGRWYPANYRWVGYFKSATEEEPVAICGYDRITNCTVQVHPYTKSKHWGKQNDVLITRQFIKWIRDNSNFIKLLVHVPEPCTHVHAAALKCGVQREAVLHGAIVWRGKLTNIIIYSVFLRGTK